MTVTGSFPWYESVFGVFYLKPVFSPNWQIDLFICFLTLIVVRKRLWSNRAVIVFKFDKSILYRFFFFFFFFFSLHLIFISQFLFHLTA